jgi:hypothetical protein
MFSDMIDDALCIDRDAEFASMDPAYGDGSMLIEAMDDIELGSMQYDELHLGVSAYA